MNLENVENKEELLDLVLKIAATSDLNVIFKLFFDKITESKDFDSGGAYIKDAHNNFKLVFAQGLTKDFTEFVDYIEYEDKRIQIALKGKPVYFENVEKSYPKNDPRAKEGIKLVYSIPVTHKGEIISIINLTSHEHGSIPEKPRADILTLVKLISNAIARARIEEKLKISEKKYRFLFDRSPYSIILLDKNGTIKDANTWSEYLTGLKKEELIGTHFTKLEIFDDETMENLILNFKDVLQKGELEFPVEARITNGEGKKKWYSIAGTVVNIAKEPMLQVFTWDISKIKKAEALLEDENKKLRDFDELRRNFVLNATHELKTPLGVVIGANSFLKENFSNLSDQKRLDFINHVDKGVTRLKDLIESLLDFSRIDSRQLKLEKIKFDIAEMIESIIAEMSYLALERDQSIEFNLPANTDLPITILGDKARLEQVIINLISNAIKNSPKKGTIRIGIQQKGEITISVEDEGVGLTKQEMSQIFQKFGKIERKGTPLNIDIQGAGIGLFLCKQIVELHGGKIWAESEGRNRGCKFSVLIPQ